jgi:uroporphyrinogen decarboxylase
VKSKEDLARISIPDVNDKLHYVFDAIRTAKQALGNSVPLIGFAGAPWTILCYMVQGKGSKTFDEARTFCYQQPETAHRLLQMITDTTMAYLKEQVAAGADCLQLFDSWGGLLGPDDFEIFSLRYSRQIVCALDEACPTILFAKGAWFALQEMAATGAGALGVDWCIRPETARSLAGTGVTIQGNFDPAKLLAPIPVIQIEVKKMIQAFGKDKYIANLGHGILSNVPVDHARAFVDAVKEW